MEHINIFIVLAIIFGILFVISIAVMIGLFIRYWKTHCPPNAYFMGTDCIECCNPADPCLKVENSKCTACIEYLFSVENGVCKANMDWTNMKNWIIKCVKMLTAPGADIDKINEELSNEFTLWVIAACNVPKILNPTKYLDKINNDLDKILKDIPQNWPWPPEKSKQMEQDWEQLWQDVLNCAN